MRQIVAASPDELQKLCVELDYLPAPNLKGITLLVDGEPVIVVGYDCWTDGSVAMHQWAKHPKYFGRDILRECFRYPFGTGDKQVAIAIVRSDNPRALVVDQKIGFTPVAVIPDAYGAGIDMHILQLRRDNCRWYRHADSLPVQPERAAAPAVGSDGAAHGPSFGDAAASCAAAA